MLLQLTIGFLAVSLTVVVEAVFIEVALNIMKRIGPWLARPPHAHKAILALVTINLWLLAALSAAVWVWAITLMVVGEFESMEPALYFAFSAFTTLGFGDVILSEGWRLLSGIAAANGLLLFGLSTAFLVNSLSRLREAQVKFTESRPEFQPE